MSAMLNIILLAVLAMAMIARSTELPEDGGRLALAARIYFWAGILGLVAAAVQTFLTVVSFIVTNLPA